MFKNKFDKVKLRSSTDGTEFYFTFILKRFYGITVKKSLFSN